MGSATQALKDVQAATLRASSGPGLHLSRAVDASYRVCTGLTSAQTFEPVPIISGNLVGWETNVQSCCHLPNVQPAEHWQLRGFLPQ